MRTGILPGATGILPGAAALLLACACSEEPYQRPVDEAEAEVVWTLGGEAESGGLVVSDLQSGALGPGGVILVAESGRLAGSQSSLVQLVSSRGHVLAAIGRFGRGPGEYVSVAGVGFGVDSLIWVADPVLGRISWFTWKGVFIREDLRPRERLPGSPWQLYPDARMRDGAILASPAGAEGVDSLPVALWLANGELERVRSVPLRSPRSLEIPRPGGGTSVTSQMLSANPIIGPASGGGWFFVLDRKPADGSQGAIVIDRYDSAGRHLDRTEIAYAAREVDTAVTGWLEGWAETYASHLPGISVSDVYSAMWIPDRLPPVQQVLADEKGYWIRRERTSGGLWQRYDLRGNLLLNVTLPERLEALAADDSTIIGWERDSLLVPLLRKYRVRPQGGGQETVRRGMILNEISALAWTSTEEIIGGSLLSDTSALIVTRSHRIHELQFNSGLVQRRPADMAGELPLSIGCTDVPGDSMASFGISNVAIRVVRAHRDTFRLSAYRPFENECLSGRPELLECRAGSLSVAMADSVRGIAACSNGRVYLLKVDSDLDLVLTPAGLTSGIFNIENDDGLWYGLPVLRLDTGYLRMVADLRSDRRRLEWLNDRGRRELTVDINDPIGFVDTDPGRRRILGLRATDPVTVLIYEWRWSTN